MRHRRTKKLKKKDELVSAKEMHGAPLEILQEILWRLVRDGLLDDYKKVSGQIFFARKHLDSVRYMVTHTPYLRNYYRTGDVDGQPEPPQKGQP